MHHYHQNADKAREASEKHKEREDFFKAEQERKSSKKKTILIASCVVIFAIVAVAGYAMLSPGKYDSFAKCLSEKGVVMYGEDWCKFTNAQKGMFGKSFKYVNYHVKQGLRVRPTWMIDGKSYETVQSFERLAELTGCKI